MMEEILNGTSTKLKKNKWEETPFRISRRDKMLKFLFKKESLIKGLDKANFYINRGKESIIREKKHHRTNDEVIVNV